MENETNIQDEEYLHLKSRIGEINPILKKMGLPQLDVVNPRELVAAELNARYYDQSMMIQLINNLKKFGSLESTPLVYLNNETGKYHIISGHHRVEGSIKANLQYIIVMITNTESENKDELIAKQLSHNVITGKDDEMVLRQLFEQITDINAKIASGLTLDNFEDIPSMPINIKIGESQELVLLFLPENLEELDAKLEDIIQDSRISKKSQVLIANIKYYDDVVELLKKIKGEVNIKNNATALMQAIEYAKFYLNTETE